jgi:hypothetical protein
MRSILNRRSTISLSVALVSLAMLPVCQAESASPSLDKHARKIEKKLSKYGVGTYVHVNFRDSSETMGSLGVLSNGNFQITDADNNKMQTYAYDDVSEVHKAKEFIGEGSEGRHHHRLLVPVAVSAAAAATAVALVKTVR